MDVLNRVQSIVTRYSSPDKGEVLPSTLLSEINPREGDDLWIFDIGELLKEEFDIQISDNDVSRITNTTVQDVANIIRGLMKS